MSVGGFWLGYNGWRYAQCELVTTKLKLKVMSKKYKHIDWVELRNNFFNECTTETPREESGKKVNMAPHDLFEWFKREIFEYVG